MQNIILNDVTLDVVGNGGNNMMIERQIQQPRKMISFDIMWFLRNIWNGVLTVWNVSTLSNFMNVVMPTVVISSVLWVIWKRWNTRHLRRRSPYKGEGIDERYDRQVISDEMQRLEEMWQYGL